MNTPAGRLTLCLLLTAAATAACTTTTGTSTTTDPAGTAAGSGWGPCGDLTGYTALLGVPGVEDLTCATTTVPVDPDDPAAGTLDVAFSRLGSGTKDVLLLNPGGPGLEGRTMPLLVDLVSDLAADFDLVGVDVRGTGATGPMPCEELLADEPPVPDDATLDDPQQARAAVSTYAAAVAAAGQACAGSDPELIASLTLANAADDLDAVREALGVERVSYLGVSWGTALGAAYQSQHPEHLDRMVLDSMVWPADDPAADIAAVLAAVGTGTGADDGGSAEAATDATGPEEPEDATDPDDDRATDDAADLDLRVVPLSYGARLAYTCDEAPAAAGPDAQWDAHTALTDRLGLARSTRIPHPASSEAAGVSACTGWPFPGPGPAARATGSSVLVVGHTEDAVTPFVWSERATDALDAELVRSDDDAHGGGLGTCLDVITGFLRTGETTAVCAS
ncbi:MAG TPA: alpha/beta fold hydrolase [Cellulomonas sp.]